LQTHLSSAQFHNNTVRILKTRDCGAAGKADTAADRRVSPGNVLRPSQRVSAPHQIGSGGTKGPDTETTHAQGVRSPAKGQRTGAATDADDETGLGNAKPDPAGFGLRRYRHRKQHERREQSPCTELYRPSHSKHYLLPTVTTSAQSNVTPGA